LTRILHKALTTVRPTWPARVPHCVTLKTTRKVKACTKNRTVGQ